MAMFQNEVTLLKSEVIQLKQLLLAHKDCPVTVRQRETQGERHHKHLVVTLLGTSKLYSHFFAM